MKRPLRFTVIAILLGLFALNAGVQALGSLGGSFFDDPPMLMLLQSLSAIVGATAAVGAWRQRPWAPIATVAYGLITGTMIISLRWILDLDEEASRGLLAGGAGTAIVCALLAFAVRPPRPAVAERTATQ